MKYKAVTDIGKKRRGNEDFLFASDKKTGLLPNLFIVADGMGGHNAGEVASEMAVETLLAYLRESKGTDEKKAIENAIICANEKVLEISRSEPGKSGMGTTLVVCTVLDSYILVASVGDSRAYIARDNKLTQITRDHTVVEEMVRLGTISKRMAATHPKRHMLTRAVGVMEHVEIDFFEIPIKGNEQILLASDGLTNMVNDTDLETILSGTDNIESKVSMLLNEANINGGEDNITFILVNIEE